MILKEKFPDVKIGFYLNKKNFFTHGFRQVAHFFRML